MTKKEIVVQKSSSRQVLNTSPLQYLFKGIVAFVEVKINQLDKSDFVTTRLKSMGATIAKRLTKRCTHLVFKDGKAATYTKAKHLGLYIVSVSWIEACRKKEIRLPEEDYPCCNRKKYECADIFPISTKSKIKDHKIKNDIKGSNLRHKPMSTKRKDISKSFTQKYPLLLKKINAPNKSKKKSKTSTLIKALFSEVEEELNESTYHDTNQNIDNGGLSYLDKTMILPYQSQSFLHSNDNLEEEVTESILPKYSTKTTQNAEQTELSKYYTSEFRYNEAKLGKNLEAQVLPYSILSSIQEKDLEVESITNIQSEHAMDSRDTQPSFDQFNFDSTLDQFLDSFLETANNSNERQQNKSGENLKDLSFQTIDISYADDVNEIQQLNGYISEDRVVDVVNNDNECLDKEVKTKSSSTLKEENSTSGKIVQEIKEICLKILKKPMTYDISNIKMKKQNSNSLKDSRVGGNIEAEIISSCAKILGYTVT